MDDYISKPIQRSETRGVCGAVSASLPGRDEHLAVSALPAFDIDRALQILDGERELLGELVEIFQSNLEERLAAIRTAVANQDLLALATAAHAIKSPVGTLSAEPAFDAILKVEQLARSGDVTAFEAPLNNAFNEISRLLPELDAFMGKNGSLAVAATPRN